MAPIHRGGALASITDHYHRQLLSGDHLHHGLLGQRHHYPQGCQQTFVIVTTAANSTTVPIHDQVPAILEGDALSLWLNPKTDLKDLRGPASACPG